MKNHIFSPGKLLITSEYFVLDGALALAVPTRLGQDFYSEEEKDGASMVFWEALHENKPWLSIQLDYKNWEIVQTNLPESAAFILKVLQNVQKLSTEKLQGMMMGMWFLASAYGQYVAGLIGAGLAQAKENAAPAESLLTYTEGYKMLGIYALIAGVVLILISPVVKKLMQEVR